MTEKRYMELRLNTYRHKLTLFERLGIRIHNAILLCKYPFLRSSEGTWYTYLDCVPVGWRLSFGMDMCEEIKEAIKSEGGWKYEVFDVKEKYGTLRWYDNASSDSAVSEVVDKYAVLSGKTCVLCGKQASWVSSGWISPFCDECKENDMKINPNAVFKEMMKDEKQF